MPTTKDRVTVTGMTAPTGQGERPGNGGRVWISGCLERLAGRETREVFYERLGRGPFPRPDA